MKRVYRKRYIKLEIDESRKLMVQSWLNFCSSKEFRRGQLETIKQFEKYGCKYFISNTLKAGALAQEDSDWAATEITPKLLAFGMPALNFIIPENKFAMLAIRNLREKETEVSDTLINYFTTLEEAIRKVDEQIQKEVKEDVI